MTEGDERENPLDELVRLSEAMGGYDLPQALRPEFTKGYFAYLAGLGFLDNPYDSYSDQGRRWIDGYVQSMQDERK